MRGVHADSSWSPPPTTGVGLAALLPCMWGYSTLGQRMSVPDEPRYRRWVQTYADPGFAALATRCAQMLDEAAPDRATAERAFLEGMRHELAFWDVPVSVTSSDLLAAHTAEWRAITAHPFVVAAADGTLDPAVFDRWVVADHHFVVGFQRFLRRLVELAPDEPAHDLLARPLAAVQDELDLFRSWAADRALNLNAEPGPIVLGYTAYIQAAPGDGWASAVAALYGAEKAYFDAWSAVRRSADTPWWSFVDNWSSAAFGEWVDDVAALLDRTVPVATADVRRTFGRVVRFEIRFWDAVHQGDSWR